MYSLFMDVSFRMPMTVSVVPFRLSPEVSLGSQSVFTPDVETDVTEGIADFHALRNRARDLVAKGAYQEAAAAYRTAVDAATAAGEVDLADEALCGWGAAETELGNGVEVMPELRRILLDSVVDHNRWLAAYTIARAHELQGAIRKALFYARLSRDISAYVDRPGLTGGSYNLLGNLHVSEGSEWEAAACYRAALRHGVGAPLPWTAAAEGNLGYCLLAVAVGGRKLRRARLRKALTLIYRGLRTLRREGAIQYTVLPHLDLCFAHLELKRPASARRHGQRALELAKRYEDAAVIKNALYLLGQVALLEGDTVTARRYLGELGQRFYPGHSGLADTLMALDLRQIVNLRA